MSIGADLRRGREQRGWSIEELAARTKIGKARLVAIESDRLDELPGAFYRRAFLRTYAREVGLGCEGAVNAYFSQLEEEKPAIVPPIADRSPLLRSLKELDWLIPHLQLAVLAILGTAAVVSLAHMNAPTRVTTNDSRPAQPTFATPAMHDSLPVAVGTGGGLELPSAAATTPATNVSPLEVEVQAQGPCWLGATADGERVVYRILEKDEHVTLRAHDELVLRIGDAGNFQFSINGAQGRSLGEPGDDLTVHLTPSNFRKFLRSL